MDKLNSHFSSPLGDEKYRIKAIDIYLKERFPVGTYSLLIAGMVLSGQQGKFYFLRFIFNFGALLLFFFILRLMDEKKDYHKDKIAHPSRPLPRGAITLGQTRTIINWGIFLMILTGLFSFMIIPKGAAVAYLITTAYLWLMYREFYMSEQLTSSPILYAISHQAIIIPIIIFLTATVHSTYTLGFIFISFGAFFTYEICRKLAPNAHSSLQTYLQVYGPKKTFIFVIATTAISAIGAYLLNLRFLLWSIETIIIIVSAITLFYKPNWHKVTERCTALSLLIHMWALAGAKLTT